MQFANSSYMDSSSYHAATGCDLDSRKAIVDLQGNVLAYAQTGGIISPTRHKLHAGAKIFRFVGAGRTPQQAATGSWWLEQAEFDKVVAFANVHGLAVGMAMRCLCLIPPEWSSVSLLIRARLVCNLLAWQGLGNSVVTPAKGGGAVSLPHQNEIAARRCRQLFIPGLNAPGMASKALMIESSRSLDTRESLQGFLYL